MLGTFSLLSTCLVYTIQHKLQMHIHGSITYTKSGASYWETSPSSCATYSMGMPLTKAHMQYVIFFIHSRDYITDLKRHVFQFPQIALPHKLTLLMPQHKGKVMHYIHENMNNSHNVPPTVYLLRAHFYSFCIV